MNTQVQFANAWVLYLLWLVPLVAWWWIASARRLESRLSAFISIEMQKKLRPASSRSRQKWQIGLIVAGLFLLLMAAARPQWGSQEEKVYQRGRDLLIALDVSRSMLANDVHPNRLIRAKADLLDLIKELHGDRAGLIAFRRKAIMLCPLTTDYAYLREALDATSPDSAPVGETDIGDAILKSIETLRNDEGAHKAIILISDGEDLSGKALDAAATAGKLNIPIFTIGIGSSSGSRIPDEEKSKLFFKHKGEDVITKLNDNTLHAIAEATKGAYLPVGTASMNSTTLGTLYRDHLSRLTAQDQEETLQRRAVERYQWFLVPAFLLLLAGTYLSRGRLAASALAPVDPPAVVLKDLNPPPRPLKNLALLFAAFCALANSAGAQTNPPAEETAAPPATAATNAPAALNIPPGREGARVAQKYYLMGKYETAAQAYLEALRMAPDVAQQDFRYNAAVSLYTGKKYKEAADLMKELFQQGKEGQARYASGLGAALYRASEQFAPTDSSNLVEKAELLKTSGEAFKEAARAQPDDKQSRKNLAVVLDALPTAQEQAKTADLMGRYEKVPAPQLADQMLQAQRLITAGIPPAFTNNSPAQIKTLEGLADLQKANSDLWIPLKGKLLNAMAQEQAKDPKIQKQVAAFEQLVETTRAYMKDSSAALRDLDPAGYNSAVTAETSIYQFWKSIAAFSSLLQEDLRRQTNNITLTLSDKQPGENQRKNLKSEQDEAVSLTDVFTKRFSESVPESGTPPKTPPSPPNATAPKAGKDTSETKKAEEEEGISAEKRRKILDLASQATAAQKSAAALLEKKEYQASLTDQRKAHDDLKEIEKLLPKDKSQNQEQKQDQKNQQQQQDQKQNEQQKKEDKQKQDQKQQDKQEQKPEEQKKEQQAEQKEQKQEKKDELSDEQVKKMLEKAAQRVQEHEEKKRERNKSIPMSPMDRDW